MDFTQATVLVTGATSGIGEATARRFARLGADVIVSGRDTERGERVVAAITSDGGKARFIRADLGDPDDVLRLAEQAGAVDILINNAGGSPFGGTVETSIETARNVYDVNALAPFLLTGKLAPRMGERGGGAIVNVTSHAGSHGTPFLAAYGASKAALNVLTKTWALEFAPIGVRVNAVSPGAVRTPPADALGEMFDQMAAATPLGRAAAPEEMATLITFLASDDAAYVTGEVLTADAGMGAA